MPPRRGATLAFVVTSAFTLVSCHPAARGPDACAVALDLAFEAASLAEQHALEVCFASAGGGRTASSTIGACVAAQGRRGLVDAARRGTALAETLACRRDALPAFGYAGAAAVNRAASASASALAQGLFGRDLDAARIPRAGDAQGRQCQERVLRRAGDCAARFVDAYVRCAVSALAGDADDAFDLVACKGADPKGAIARVCEAGIDVAAAECEGADAAAWFPGCAGDLAACARGHARRSASLAINDANALCRNVRVGSLEEGPRLQCFEPPPPEPIVYTEVPLPPDVNPTTVEWDDAGESLIVSFPAQAPLGTGTQLASLRSDGSTFRCLTCGSPIAGNLRPVQRFRDGRRVLVAGPNNPNPRWNVLECTPSVSDCQGSVLLPIQLPPNPDPATPIAQYRVPWVSLDDGWLVWTEVRLRGPGGNLSAMGRLVRDASRYVVTDARVIAPPLRSLEIGTDSRLWRNFTQPFEAKFGALRGGLDWVEAGTPSAGQYDASLIDLTSGEIRRMTHHPDHDEGIRFSRDEQWAVLQSARTDGRTEFLGLLPRPPYIDWIAFSLHFVAIAGAPSDGLSPGGNPDERDCFVDPWLVDRWFERGDYIGQRLLKPADGWVSIEGNAGGFGWSPDGTRVALIERRWRHSPDAGRTRLRIAALPSRAPIDPANVVPVVPAPDPTWAIRYEDWRVPNTFGVTVIPGLVSGTATIHNDMPSVVQGAVEVVYDRYSDDGLGVLDGFERLRIPVLLLQSAEYAVDLTLSGVHAGSMRGTVTYDFVGDVNTGEVVSELDGRVLSGPRTCFEAGLIPIP